MTTDLFLLGYAAICVCVGSCATLLAVRWMMGVAWCILRGCARLLAGANDVDTEIKTEVG